MSDTLSQNLQAARGLRNLYFVRTVVQFLWAGAVMATAIKNPALAATLLILYPLWDVACTLYDLKYSFSSDSGATQYQNAILGGITAIGIGFTAFSHPVYAVMIFGGWAFLAGLLQLRVGILRRKQLGGQWAMILSGVQSMAAGVAFALGGLSGKFHIKDLGGYAVLGGVYFLIGGIFLSRKLRFIQPAAILALGLFVVCGLVSA
ncbi:MAG TPA: hypothetical protein VGG95_05575 [Edaphobacter sp.]|jgi:uncharacterized membrane protein HdeD (DUF308 family)